MNVLETFHPAVRTWFVRRFGRPTDAQELAWPEILAGRNTLLAAPTGSGKTLAAFLAAIDRLLRRRELEDEVQVVYVSPLKALSNDIQRNLEEPLAEISQVALELGYPAPTIRTALRTGDTTAARRREIVRRPPHILITTPESLYLMITAEKSRAIFATVETMIVDEIHALLRDKRGSHLALTLARMDHLARRKPVRIGLSATQRPIETSARFLVGVEPEWSPEMRLAGVNRADRASRSAPGEATTESRDGKPPRDASSAGLLSQESLVHEVRASFADPPDCSIIDIGHQRDLDLGLELPETELQAVCSNDQWKDIHDRLARLIERHRTTLVFVNTRRVAERTAHHLGARVGENRVASHHGSLSKDRRLHLEQRLKAGEMKALVATASLELGIDIGTVDLVCQIESPRSVSTLLQRVGRSGHALGLVPKGRIFPTTRDELIECLALVRAVRQGRLDALHPPVAPLDILAQQIVAECACEEWREDDLYNLSRGVAPYASLDRRDFDDVVEFLSEGIPTGLGRAAYLLHRDRIHHVLRGRRAARRTAIESGGAIPEAADFRVVAEPDGAFVGTLNEDFVTESMAGDTFVLGATSWRIRRIEPGLVRVEDAGGAPPSIPFWLGEAPSRTPELSEEVSGLRGEIGRRLEDGSRGPEAGRQVDRPLQEVRGEGREPDERRRVAMGGTDGGGMEDPGGESVGIDPDPGRSTPPGTAGSDESGRSRAGDWLIHETGCSHEAARQLVRYVESGRKSLGLVPTRTDVVFERFFDESGGMQLVIHAPFGGRINRAWGLALRKRFCRTFDFELQAAASDDAVLLSLGAQNSFPLEDVFRFLDAATVEETLAQAVLASPMFTTRWRWNATRALALQRQRHGKRTPPPIQRMRSDDLLASVFPQQVACQENVTGPIAIPDHPLVRQTMHDCLHEAMDVGGLQGVLRAIEAGEIRLHARDTTEPSPFSHEMLNSKPYTFLDDAPLEERRARAVALRRTLPEDSRDLAALDAAAIDRVRREAWPDPRNAEEAHEALLSLVVLREGFTSPSEEGPPGAGASDPEHKASESEHEVTDPKHEASDSEHEVIDPGHEATDPKREASGAGSDSVAAWSLWFEELIARGRAARGFLPGGERIWFAAENLPLVQSLYKGVEIRSNLALPEELRRGREGADEALVSLVRGHMECIGPLTAPELAFRVALPEGKVATALSVLEGEGSVLRGRFRPARETRPPAGSIGEPSGTFDRQAGTVDANWRVASTDAQADRPHPAGVSRGGSETEFCDRRLLARIHRLTLDRLRSEIEPVSASEHLRFLFRWQHVAPGSQVEGKRGLREVIGQLQGFEVPAIAWEREILASRVSGYTTQWLDELCLTGEVTWGRLSLPDSARQGEERSAPASSITAISLIRRSDLGWLLEGVRGPARPVDPPHGAAADVLEPLRGQGALFHEDLVRESRRLAEDVERGLWELVARGLVNADSFQALRALMKGGSRHGAQRRRRARRGRAFTRSAPAGRWALLPEPRPGTGGVEGLADAWAGQLLTRYGVVFRDVVQRESCGVPWRELLRSLRRMESRGEVRGGRFIQGFYGEQYALPHAVGMLRQMRRVAAPGERVRVSAVDPLNLAGILTPGPRVPAVHTRFVEFVDGVPQSEEGAPERTSAPAGFRTAG